jgi:hypothetical protein
MYISVIVYCRLWHLDIWMQEKFWVFVWIEYANQVMHVIAELIAKANFSNVTFFIIEDFETIAKYLSCVCIFVSVFVYYKYTGTP